MTDKIVDSVEDADLAELFEGAEDMEQIRETIQEIEDEEVRKELEKKIELFEKINDGQEPDSDNFLQIDV